MQNYKFPTREELLKMPLSHVRAQDIKTIEQEYLIQEIVNLKLGQQGIDGAMINRTAIVRDNGKYVDIKTKEQENHFQALIDAETEKLKAKQQTILPLSEEVLEAKISEIEKKQEEIKAVTPEIVNESLSIPELKRFCEFCDSKGVRHKLNCTRERL
jgi:hypothetical protein